MSLEVPAEVDLSPTDLVAGEGQERLHDATIARLLGAVAVPGELQAVLGGHMRLLVWVLGTVRPLEPAKVIAQKPKCWRYEVIVVRFKVQCQADKTSEMAAVMKDVVDAARELPGVIHFDIARDLTDADSLIATEIFEDKDAMEREEALPEVAKVVELMQSGALAGPPEWTVFHVGSSESPAM
jgi:quinol monooxygenase YgiN